jgi:hypothetical protein
VACVLRDAGSALALHARDVELGKTSYRRHSVSLARRRPPPCTDRRWHGCHHRASPASPRSRYPGSRLAGRPVRASCQQPTDPPLPVGAPTAHARRAGAILAR